MSSDDGIGSRRSVPGRPVRPRSAPDTTTPADRRPVDHVRVRAVAMAVFLAVITLLVVVGRDLPVESTQVHPFLGAR